MSKLPRRPKPAKPPSTAKAPPDATLGAPPPRARARSRPKAPATPKALRSRPKAPATPKPPPHARPTAPAAPEPPAQARRTAPATPKHPRRAAAKAKPAPPRPDPADQLDRRLREPEEGAYLYGLEKRVVHPTLVKELTEAGGRIVTVLGEHDAGALWPLYETLEFEVGWARERSAFGFGFEHGAAQGRAEAFRRQAPGLHGPARRLADRARALVVNEGLSYRDAAALLLETTWVVLLAHAPPAYEG